MANLPISGLTASASNLAASDLVPVVQTPGVGPVKMTGTQIKTGIIGAGSVSIASGKTFTSSNTLTLAGTDSTTMTFPSTSATLARTDAGNTFTGAQTFSVGTVNGTGLDITQTWGGTGTYTGLKYNVTDSGPSNAASLLLDIGTGGGSYVSKFRVDKSGAVFVEQLKAATSAIKVFSSFYVTTDFRIGSSTSIGFSGVFDPANAAPDVILNRAAAATLQLGAADTSASATVTITIATPGVVTWSDHSLSTGTPVVFSTTGALPTGITAGTTYYVIAVNTNTFQIATSYANATAVSPTAVNTSGSQSGTHTGTRGAVDQIFRVQSASGTANFPGADFAIQGSRGTGTGAGGSIIFQVAPAGSTGTAQNAYSTALTINSASQFTFAAGSSSSPTLRFSNSGWYSRGGNWAYGGGGNQIMEIAGGGTGGPSIISPYALTFGLDPAGYPPDVFLYRDTTSTLALRNGNSTGAAQRFNVYNTYTSSTNYETFKIDWITTANTCLIGTEKGSGGGTARSLALQTNGTTRLTIAGTGAAFVFASDAFITFSGKDAGLDSPSTGNFRFANELGNDFGRLQFGGTTSSYPALKRVSANLQVIAADGSSSAGFIVGNQALATTATDGFLYIPTCAGTPTGTPTTQTGTAPIVVDTTNNKLYFYSGGQWRDAGP